MSAWLGSERREQLTPTWESHQSSAPEQRRKRSRSNPTIFELTFSSSWMDDHNGLSCELRVHRFVIPAGGAKRRGKCWRKRGRKADVASGSSKFHFLVPSQMEQWPRHQRRSGHILILGCELLVGGVGKELMPDGQWSGGLGSALVDSLGAVPTMKRKEERRGSRECFHAQQCSGRFFVPGPDRQLTSTRWKEGKSPANENSNALTSKHRLEESC